MSYYGRAEKLREARAIVLEVLGTLNRERHKCGSCGLAKDENWPEAQKAKELESLAEKLNKLAKGLESMSNTETPSAAPRADEKDARKLPLKTPEGYRAQLLDLIVEVLEDDEADLATIFGGYDNLAKETLASLEALGHTTAAQRVRDWIEDTSEEEDE